MRDEGTEVDGQRSPSGRRSRLRPATAAVLTAAVLASGGCGSGSAGDDAAGQEMDAAVGSLVREAEQRFRRASTDPVWLARWAANETGPRRYGTGQTFQVVVEPLAWRSPEMYAGELDVRVRVHADDYQANSIGGTSYAAGNAEECLRITLDGGPAAVEAIDCTGRNPALIPPAPPPLPPLDDDALREALQQPDLARATASARRSFPGTRVTGQEIGDTRVVVVSRGSADDLECLGGTRDGQGDIRVTGVGNPQPGEGDCEPAAFTGDQ